MICYDYRKLNLGIGSKSLFTAKRGIDLLKVVLITPCP